MTTNIEAIATDNKAIVTNRATYVKNAKIPLFWPKFGRSRGHEVHTQVRTI
jgi:hypothetical protein